MDCLSYVGEAVACAGGEHQNVPIAVDSRRVGMADKTKTLFPGCSVAAALIIFPKVGEEKKG